ncbi:MAG TPA: DNA translocase FtsK [Ktedonobacteraceae bacterium]|nr:DNA translocase FtsK [Ktedonobacteraceae bacterium]
MAGNQKKERLVPGVVASKTSRVSKAAGSVGSSQMRVEQRSSPSGARQRAGSNRRANSQASGTRKSVAASPTRRKGPAAGPSMPADSRLISKVQGKWGDMQPHEQQRVFSVLLLVLACILFLALTLWNTQPLFRSFSGFFFTVFGWGAIPLSLGLIAYALAHLVEGIRNVRFIRWSLVLGLLGMLILLLVESQLLVKNTGGILGILLATPLSGWGPGAHVLVLGLLLVAALLTFKVTLSQLWFVLHSAARVFQDPRSGSSGTGSRASPFLGQRPRYSRYGGNSLSNNTMPPSSPARQVLADEDEDEEDQIIDFEPASTLLEDDDPLDDIHKHLDQVGRAPKGPRAAQQLNREEHLNAVKGARQQELFPEKPPDVHLLEEMEPLAPNPLRAKPSQPVRRASEPAAASPWKLPDISLLNSPEDAKLQLFGDDTTALAKTIQDTLRSFRVEAEVRPEDISIGPTVIRFGIRPTGKPQMKKDEKGRDVPVKDAAGNIVYEVRTRVSRIMALQNDLALVLESKTIRMEAPVPGRPYVGVEIPNKNSRLVTLREILESKEYQAARTRSRLAVALGKDVAGAVRVGDLAKMPHLLIAGATGSGKSVCINAIISSLISQATPDDVRILMVDPKMVELTMYNGVPHLLAPVVTDVEKVVGLLKVAIAEMEKRYRLFSQIGVRNLDGYRKLRTERLARGDETMKNLPAIVIIIDELADLMMAAPEEVEGLICRLAQLARATGIHLVVATQRPSVDVITGLIKANIPTRISFMVSSAVDSRTIIDMGGAERLLGRGDMLYLPADAGKPERIQGAFVADEEAERLVQYWHRQAAEQAARQGEPPSATPSVEPGWEVSERPSDEFELEDELLEQAEQVVQEYERASISLLQRRLKIGYSRAARLIDLLEERGIISRAEPGGRSREVLEPRNGSSRQSSGEGRTLADEAADIIEEERQREEFLKKQAERDAQQKRKSGEG